MTRDSSPTGTPDWGEPTEPVVGDAAHDTDPYTPSSEGAAQPPAVREESEHVSEDTKTAHQEKPAKVQGSLAAGTWVALIVGTLILILLIVFILQNQDPVDINLFGWNTELPAAIAYLLSAIAGALIMALVGGWRMFELRRQVKKAYKS